jgi:hypothetical protein
MALFATLGASGLFSGGTGLAAAGMAASGAGSILGGMAQGRAYDRQARGEIDAAAAREAMLRRDNRKREGATRAALAGSGLTIEGSPLDLIADEANISELNARLVRYDGAARAAELRNRGRAARLGGLVEGVGSMAMAGSTLLGGQLSYARLFGDAAPASVGSQLGYGGMVGGSGIGQAVLV